MSKKVDLQIVKGGVSKRVGIGVHTGI